ncbi:MAG: alanine--tRNA ligase [Candidatus Delongbacteria bacterium]|jgi:alanyl-tRNA synthetase|nr:alanine--tRNA ligase [Candidatus Delongbacteria bacterium]
MTSKQIRQQFLDYFKSKGHKAIPSAPMVLKDDPTLMFTNAGMNQFKDVFLGNAEPVSDRVCDSQKCLRVSGKHNDLEEVGHDTYHHTMFEMLGNWSFGDYFKEEAIDMAWELFTKVYKIDKDRLYVTIFEGDSTDGLLPDSESGRYWKKHVDDSRILPGSKKDNFWEMGDTGPCGPCSEIHIDMRSDKERKEEPGENLVNKDHPRVIELWNLVFIQYNRKADKTLEALPKKHVDTGMGFERLCMVLQNKKSNYDTDLFKPLIREIAAMAGLKYGKRKKHDVAMRVIADHVRAVIFSIADGQLPSNVKAGYVIRRILRRAVRYGYSFLGFKGPFINELVDVLVKIMGEAYPELIKQQKLIARVIKEEEAAFFRTLDKGMDIMNGIIKDTLDNNYRVISGKDAFSLYDTYGFPFDLTDLLAREQNLVVNRKEFHDAMQEQKQRARNDAKKDTGDWIVLREDKEEEFVGYDMTEADVVITKYREIKKKKSSMYQLVFNLTPFYAESGGQVGDRGRVISKDEHIDILDTQKENNLIVHITKKLPEDLESEFKAQVDFKARHNSARNHSATHLMHKALRDVLGKHVEQKGSLVHPDYLRFDFSHFEKLSPDDLRKIESQLNENIRENIQVEEHRNIPLEKAKNMGAMAFFGEKYGDLVRVIKFGDSTELCGGIHVMATGEIGFFKITMETSVAAGIRRIEALTGQKAEQYIMQKNDTLQAIESKFKNSKNILRSVENALKENSKLQKDLQAVQKQLIEKITHELETQAKKLGDYKMIVSTVNVNSPTMLKDLSFRFRHKGNIITVFAANIEGKPNMAIMIPDKLTKEKDLNAGNIVRNAAKEFKGGGGGQAFFATAGGADINGIDAALAYARKQIESVF